MQSYATADSPKGPARADRLEELKGGTTQGPASADRREKLKGGTEKERDEQL